MNNPVKLKRVIRSGFAVGIQVDSEWRPVSPAHKQAS